MTDLSFKHRSAYALSCLSLIGIAPSVFAQGMLEQVTVTAQKVSEDLQRIPISMSALTAESIEKKNITDMVGVAQNSPSISFAPNPGSSNTLILYMRGQGAAVPNAPSSEGGIGLYQDGFYIGRPSGITFDLADLDRVEVLRGPQGTLYGRNSTGGAVNLISRRPSGELGFRQTLDFGTRDKFRSLTTIDLPRWNTLSTKFTLLKSSIDGYVKNAGSGHDFGEQEQQGGRLQLRWDPAQALSVDYFMDYGEIADTPTYYQNASLEGLTIQGYPYTHADRPRDRAYRPVDLDSSHTRNEAHGLTVAWDASEAITIKSLTGYRKMVSDGNSDLVEAITVAPGVPLHGAGSALTRSHQFSQELQLLGTPSEALRYVGGLYYFDEHVSYDTLNDLPDYFLVSQQISSTDSSSIAAFGQVTWTPPVLEDNLELTLGARYTRDKRDSDRFIAMNGLILEDGAATGSTANLTFSRFNPMFTANYRWTDSISSYAKVATGYRAGGTYEGAPTGQFELGAFGPEDVTTYEIGLKSDWWDQSLRINAAIFDSHYDDLQIYIPIDPSDATRALFYNIGKANVRGLEVDVAWAVTEDIQLSLAYAYLDPTFKQVDVVPGSIYDNAANPLSPYRVGDNLKGLFALPYAPGDSLSAGVDYTFLRFASAELALHLDYRWESETYSGAVGGPDVPGRQFDVRPSYGLFNGNLTLAVDLPRGDRAKISVWGKNIFDHQYRQHVIANGAAGVAVQSPTTGVVTSAGYHDQAAAWAEPAAFGVQLQYEY
jgi:iron complex outermembrane recepter protein